MAANVLFDQLGRQRNDRVYRERIDHLDQMRDEEVRKRYRFNKESIRFICNLLRDKLQQPTKRSQALSVELQVLIALRFYATGNFLQVLGDTVGIDKGTASRVVRKVSLALSELLPVYVKWPSEDEKREIKNDFYKMAGFPGVIGCIDGTHVRIQRPSENEPAFINRKGYPSINVQAVCDSKGRFTNLVARWPGSTHDSHMLRTSNLRTVLERDNNGLQNGILLGDSGYACKPYLVTPYLRPSDQSQERYNGSHCRTRVTIERAFGWWKRRFHCLHGELRMHPERLAHNDALHCFKGACAVLHNLAILLREPQLDQDQDVDIGEINGQNNGQEDGNGVRNYITRTFF
ncbi:HARBI1 [Mytilus edulis]|nr:HARBI1 [Mytilus edulis]